MTSEEFKHKWLPLSDGFFRAALYMLGSEAEAEDAVQDLYVKLWNRRDALDDINTPAAYGLTMVKRLCIDRLRHKAATKSGNLEEADADDPGSESILISRDTLSRAGKLLEALPEKQKTALKMRALEGREYKEMAALTGLTELNLRVLVSLARKTLKKQLYDERY